MKTDKSEITKKILTSFLALSLMTGALTACNSPSGGTSGQPRPTGSTEDSKREYDPADETTVEETYGTTAADDSEYVFNIDDWNVSEYDEKGLKYKQIQNLGWHGRNSEFDYLLFKVYGSEEDAKTAYQRYYDKSKDYDKGHWEEGENWFISDEWGVMDASIVWMVYREGNMLIIADLAMNGHWIVYGDDAASNGAEPTESTFKAYILNNIPVIVRFVEENFDL